MSIRICSDSACDFDIDTVRKYDIDMLHLRISFGEKEYSDGLDLSHDEFFEKLIETDALPTTSQISPYIYEEYFKTTLTQYDDVIYISISSKLSGCHQSASLAANSLGSSHIFVVDSENASLGQYALVLYATRLRDEGLSAEEIVDKLNTYKKKIKLIALIDTLEYLQKGGRLSKSAAMVGSLISIKPVIGVKDGEVIVLGKARGSKKGNNLLTELAKQSGGFDYSMPIILAYSGLSDHMLKKYIEDNRHYIEDKVDVDSIPTITIGAAIGTHVGPGAIGIAFFSRE